MAMDKDRLLQYFQQQYLSRQEVLFKLPLNVSIGYLLAGAVEPQEGRSYNSSAVQCDRYAVLVCADREDDLGQ